MCVLRITVQSKTTGLSVEHSLLETSAGTHCVSPMGASASVETLHTQTVSKFLDAPKYLVGLVILFNKPNTHALLLKSMSRT